jgi:hypothetical protein
MADVSRAVRGPGGAAVEGVLSLLVALSLFPYSLGPRPRADLPLPDRMLAWLVVWGFGLLLAISGARRARGLARLAALSGLALCAWFLAQYVNFLLALSFLPHLRWMMPS